MFHKIKIEQREHAGEKHERKHEVVQEDVEPGQLVFGEGIGVGFLEGWLVDQAAERFGNAAGMGEDEAAIELFEPKLRGAASDQENGDSGAKDLRFVAAHSELEAILAQAFGD